MIQSVHLRRWGAIAVLTTSAVVNALTPPAAPLSPVAVLYPAPDEVQLSKAHKTNVDEQVRLLKGTKCANWPERSEASVTFYLSPATLPRRDYQRIGGYLESLRGYLRSEHEFRFTPMSIVVRDSPRDGEQPSEQILINFYCPHA